MRGTSDSRRRARVIAALGGGMLAVIGAAAIVVGVAGQQPAPPAPPAMPSAATPNQPDKDQSATTSDQTTDGLSYSEPVRVHIPTIGVRSTLEDLGLDSSGVMTTPRDPDKAGWFTPSPAPGVVGASVLAGHVTWNEDRSVFFRLGELRAGDQIRVERQDGITVVFEVTKLGEFPKDDFPTDAVYQRVGQPELRLITCGGAYDEQRNNYRSNVIVWAEMVGSHRA